MPEKFHELGLNIFLNSGVIDIHPPTAPTPLTGIPRADTVALIVRSDDRRRRWDVTTETLGPGLDPGQLVAGILAHFHASGR